MLCQLHGFLKRQLSRTVIVVSLKLLFCVAYRLSRGAPAGTCTAKTKMFDFGDCHC